MTVGTGLGHKGVPFACNQLVACCVKGSMSSLARAMHPKMILGAVGAAIAIPVLGITISFVSVSANTQQNTSTQQEANATVVATPTPAAVPAITNAPGKVVEPKAVQFSLPDPLAPEPSTSTLPAPEAVTTPTPVASAQPIVEQTPSAAPTPTSTVKASMDAQDAQNVQAPRAVKKETEVARSWTPLVLNPGTVSLRAPKLTSGVKVSVTVACSPSASCVINGDQLTFSEGTQVTVTYRAKATDTHTAWSTTISN